MSRAMPVKIKYPYNVLRTGLFTLSPTALGPIGPRVFKAQSKKELKI
jgi:hypothetical protein